MQPLHQHEDLFGTLILQQSKVDTGFLYCTLVREHISSYAWQWPEWKFED